jgi:hypothetical protein
MNVVITNLSGNTGKTTLAVHMLAPLLQAKRLQIESQNTADGTPDLEISAKLFASIADEINMAEDNIVIDIGSSDARLMLEKFSELSITRDLIDAWLLPVTPKLKEIADTVRTIQSLLAIGVPPEKVVVVFNEIDDPSLIPSTFEAIFKLQKAVGFHVAPVGVRSSEIYDRLKNTNKSVFAIADVPFDFRAQKAAALEAKKQGNMEKFHEVAQMSVLHPQAQFAAQNLREVFRSTPIAALVMA